MSRLLIVPARGGSKRLPNKNILPLDGKPLICYTIDAAIGLFDLIVVSTDSQEIFEIVNERYKMTPAIRINKRPAALATDTSKAIDVVRHCFDEYDKVGFNGKKFDSISLMLPTCPLREKENVEEALETLEETDVSAAMRPDSVVSVTDYEFPPALSLGYNSYGFLIEHNPALPFANDNTRSQDLPMLVRPNGAIYASRWNSFGRYRNFFKGKVDSIYMSREQSVDIDTELDLVICEAVMKWRRSRKGQ